MKAIIVHKTGGPEMLRLEKIALGTLDPGEIHIKQTAIGVNFIDVYHRTGLYKVAGGRAFIPGQEAAGIVLAVGPGGTL